MEKNEPKTKLKQYTYKNGDKEKNLYVDSDGKFHVRIFHNSRVFTKKLLALRLMEAISEKDEFIVDVRKEALGITPRKKIPSVSKAIELWKAGKKGEVSENYIESSGRILIRILDPISHYYIDKITTAMLKKVVMDYHNKPFYRGTKLYDHHSERTTNTNINLVKSLFTYIYDTDIVKGISPAAKLKYMTEPEKKRNVVQRATFKEFFREVDALGFFHLSFFYRACFYLGLRNSEARFMKWASFNEEDKTYTPGQHGLTKGREATSLDIPDEMMVWFQKASQQEVKSLIYICVNKKTQMPYGIKNLEYHMDKISEKLKTKFTPHSLRASYITLLSQKYDLPTVKELARHADIETTMLYVNVSKKRMKEAVKNTFSNLA